MLVGFADLTFPGAVCLATGMYATGAIPVLLYGTTWRHDLTRAYTTTQHATARAARDTAITSAAALALILPADGSTP